MKKEAIFVISLLVFSIIFSSLAYAQSYSFFERFTDNIKIFFAKGNDKVKLALEIREKEINSAIENIKTGNTGNAISNIEDAGNKLEIVQQEVSPEIADEVKLNIEEIEKKIMEAKEISPEFSSYLEKHLTEEEKTQLSADLSVKISALCEELAKQDYKLMMEEEKCNPDNAPDWLKDKINKEFKEQQEQMVQEMLEQLTVCMTDPRQCDCSKIPSVAEQQKCEKGTALMIRCEFQSDEKACNELEKMGPPTPPSDMPAFLKLLFQKKLDELMKSKEEEMFKKFAPKECQEAGARSREDCEKVMMEKHAPRECIEAGATTKEDCEKIMFAKYGPPPTECTENGEFIGEEACNEKMIASGKIPQECIKDNKPISREECEKKMVESGRIPKECIDEQGKPIPEQECLEKMLPPPCKEANAFTREACEEVMRNYKGPPMECLDEQGNFIGDEQCEKIMQEKGFQPPQEEGMQRGMPRTPGTGEMKIPQECVGLTFKECEEYLMKNYMPRECVEAQALTPEACKKVMLPRECKEANAFTREECESIMIKERMPKECQDAKALTPEECGKILGEKVRGSPGSETDFLQKKGISFSEIPDVCKQGSNFVRGMECDKALAEKGITLPPPADISNIPRECVVNGQAVSPQECQEIMKNKIVNENIPGECREKGIVNPNECGRFMEKEKQEQGMGINMPPECIGKTPEACKQIMEEKGIRMEPPKPPEERSGERMPGECREMGVADNNACNMIMSKINEERMKNGERMIITSEGEKEYITNEQINKIAEQAEQRAETIQPDLQQVNEIKQEVVQVEQKIEQVEMQAQAVMEERAEQQMEQAPQQEPQSPPSQEQAPEPAPSEALTGEAIREITPQAIIKKILEFFLRKPIT